MPYPISASHPKPPRFRVGGKKKITKQIEVAVEAIAETEVSPAITKPVAQITETIAAEPVVSEPVVVPTNTAASISKKKLPSLTDIQSGNFTIQKEEKVEHIRTEREAFTESDFSECWENCIAELKKKNQSSLNVMLASIQVTEVSKEQYKAVFPNKIQHDLYLQEKAFIMQFMREGLKNFSLEIVEEVTPQVNDYKPYTGAEKFKALAEKNPTLIELQEKLGLDLA